MNQFRGCAKSGFASDVECPCSLKTLSHTSYMYSYVQALGLDFFSLSVLTFFSSVLLKYIGETSIGAESSYRRGTFWTVGSDVEFSDVKAQRSTYLREPLRPLTRLHLRACSSPSSSPPFSQVATLLSPPLNPTCVTPWYNKSFSKPTSSLSLS